MTWLTDMEYLCHKWPRICSTCRQHFLVLTTQWPKEKVQRDKQQSTKHTYKIKDRVTRIPLKTRRELGCFGRVGSFCSTHRVNPNMFRSPPWLGWPIWNICVTNDHGYVPLVVNTFWSFPHSRLITGFVTRLTRRVEQKLPTLPKHPSSLLVFSGIRVTRSLILYVCFVDCCLPFIKEILIGTTSSGISYHLREIYSICRCCWNVATYKWKVHSGNIYSDMLCSSVLFVFILYSVCPTYCLIIYVKQNYYMSCWYICIAQRCHIENIMGDQEWTSRDQDNMLGTHYTEWRQTRPKNTTHR
jgi:hypothetical protein